MTTDYLATALRAVSELIDGYVGGGDPGLVLGKPGWDEAERLLALSVRDTPAGRQVVLSGVHRVAMFLRCRRQAAQQVGWALGEEELELAEALLGLLAQISPEQRGHQHLVAEASQLLAADPFNATVIRCALTRLRQAVEVSVGAEDHGLALGSLGGSLVDLYQLSGDRAELQEAIAVLWRALSELPPTAPVRPVLHASLGRALFLAYGEEREPSWLDSAETELRSALAELTSPGDRLPALADLAATLEARARLTGQPEDVSAAVLAARAAVALMPRDNPSFPQFSGMLGRLLGQRWASEADESVVDEWVGAMRAALPAEVLAERRVQEPEALAVDLMELATALTASSDQLEEGAQELDEAITLLRAVVQLLPDSMNALSALGVTLRTRALRGGGPGTDLGEAVELLTAAMVRGGTAEVEVDLGETLRYRFAETGAEADLDSAISSLRRALRSPGLAVNFRYKASVGLGTALHSRYLAGSNESDLDESIEFFARAKELSTVESMDWFDAVNGLAGALLERYQRMGLSVDIQDAVREFEHLDELSPADPSARGALLLRRGTAYWQRHAHFGEFADSTRAVQLLRQALELLPPEGTAHRDARIVLGSALATRARQRGSSTEGAEAVRCFQSALLGMELDDPERPNTWVSLALALSEQGQRIRQVPLLDEAVRAYRMALDFQASHRTLENARLGLGSALAVRASLSRQVADLDEAVPVLRELLAVTDPRPDRHAGVRINLATALKLRHELVGDRGDLHEAIAAVTEGMARSTETTEPLLRVHLAELLRARDEPGDAAAAHEAFREVAGNPRVPSWLRLHSARCGGALAVRTARWEEAVSGYAQAVDLLSLVAWPGLARQDQQDYLQDNSGLASEAAAVALSAGRPETAVELLEHGRAVLWSQALETRGDPAYGSVAQLREQWPELAGELERVRADLRAAAEADLSELAHREQELVARIRALPGFAGFARRKGFAELRLAATQGPVVLLTASRERCDALIVTAEHEVRVVPLEITLAQTAEQSIRVLNLPLGKGFGGYVTAQETLLEVLDWLADNVVEPVLRALPDAGRLWWCPVGPFALLPLHAAADQVVSSYTTTLTTLLRARNRPSTQDRRRLVVGVAGTPPLRNVAEEVALVQREGSTLLGEAATADRVLAELASHPWLHIACHAWQDTGDPSRSALALHDRPLTVAEIAGRDLAHAEFAFLSACETAASAQLLDESISLASALHLAGYRDVIGTLWPIQDRCELAAEVYRSLDGTPPTGPAEALHRAAHRLRRDHPDEPSMWAGFLHHGP
ncbi:CHAT domain-containing protein [Kutzneria viridogrisea]|uniref:Tetratricopeptide (TPR) repeat protein n=1 Tax=Kutzneria viridogrisea TaxID=47990 RepID=A0ABR6B8F8_9PSEU|nr:tetratricopeptide (TPR) repeat protein [Kutzneria viridogrisea]